MNIQTPIQDGAQDFWATVEEEGVAACYATPSRNRSAQYVRGFMDARDEYRDLQSRLGHQVMAEIQGDW